MNVDWNMVSAIGTCFGALATFMAVAVALWQASVSSYPKVKAWLSYSYEEHERKEGKFYNFVAGIEVVNVGIACVSIKELRYRDVVTKQRGSLEASSLFPIEGKTLMLASGESAEVKFLPLTVIMPFQQNPTLLMRIKSRLLDPCKLDLVASSGKTFKIHLEKEAKRSLRQYSANRLRDRMTHAR